MIIYSLVKTSMFDSYAPARYELSETQWEDIYKELIEQAIDGIPAEWVFASVKLPQEIYNKWTQQYIRKVGFFYQLLYEQKELVCLMSKHHIPIAIIKGTAAAIYYPNPSARVMGDIDFLVPEDDFQRAYHLLLDNGYKLQYDEDNVDYHITLTKNRVVFEIHKEPAGMPKGAEGHYLKRIIKDGISSINVVCLDNYEVPILPSLSNGIVLLLHIVKHLKSGLGLRQIIDWMMYVDKELNNDNWYGNMQPVLQKVGYEKLAQTVTRMCQIYLGLKQENITWCMDVDETICEKLMNYIMYQGNFGRKVMEEDRGIKIMEEIRNPFQIFILLQQRGENNWKFLEKHPKARIFAWVYMACRYICKISNRKSPIKTLVNDIHGGNERKDLFEQIGFNYDKN